MTIDLTDYGEYEEFLVDYTFRNEGEIKIPKGKREIAYEQSVDIIVESVAYPQYQNGKSNPVLSFYGYATLVFQDCLTKEIPIVFPRQRIHSDKQWAAFAAWDAEKAFWENWQFHRKNDISLATIMGSLSIPYEELEATLKPFVWVELPLREVYVKLLSPSQFKIEYRQIEPVPYTDPYGNRRDGKSGQEDGDKDGGLPSGGILPKVNSPSNPFAGNTPVNTPSFDSGFLAERDKLSEQADDPNDVPATPTTLGYYIRVVSSGCTSLFNILPERVGAVVDFYDAYSDSTIVVKSDPISATQACGRSDLRRIDFDIVSPTKGITASTFVLGYGGLSGEVLYGFRETQVTVDGINYP